MTERWPDEVRRKIHAAAARRAYESQIAGLARSARRGDTATALTRGVPFVQRGVATAEELAKALGVGVEDVLRYLRFITNGGHDNGKRHELPKRTEDRGPEAGAPDFTRGA